MRPRLSVYSDRVAYERLGDFVQDYMNDVPCLSASHAHDSTSEVADDLDGGRMKAGRATGIMAVVVIVAFSLSVVGCASPQEQESPGAAGGENVAEPAREACASRTGAAIPPLSAYGIYDC